jgi:hypothetical protein
MFKKFKQWREKWTVDHTIDVIIDMLLLVIDVISSPILIVVRIIRYIVGDWVVNRIKSSVKWIAHFYLERCNRFFKFVLAIVFLIVIPIVIAFASGLFEVFEFWFEELDNSF